MVSAPDIMDKIWKVPSFHLFLKTGRALSCSPKICMWRIISVKSDYVNMLIPEKHTYNAYRILPIGQPLLMSFKSARVTKVNLRACINHFSFGFNWARSSLHWELWLKRVALITALCLLWFVGQHRGWKLPPSFVLMRQVLISTPLRYSTPPPAVSSLQGHKQLLFSLAQSESTYNKLYGE